MNKTTLLTDYPFSKLAQKIATENWMKERISNGAWVFATFTFRNNTSPAVASNAIETLRHRLSKSIYKNAYRRRGKLLDIIPVIEGDNLANRVHLHAAIKVPDQLTSTEFGELIIDRWKSGRIEYREIISEDVNRTVGYLLKSRTKTHTENLLSAF